jgi:hypothetical protein
MGVSGLLDWSSAAEHDINRLLVQIMNAFMKNTCCKSKEINALFGLHN